jgi:hypothetical protein
MHIQNHNYFNGIDNFIEHMAAKKNYLYKIATNKKLALTRIDKNEFLLINDLEK